MLILLLRACLAHLGGHSCSRQHTNMPRAHPLTHVQ